MTLNCNGKIIDFSSKKIMGIVNISEDSFYDGGKFNTIEKVNSHVSNLISNGADIIDLGAASSKPGSNLIKPDHEYDLVAKYINELTSNFKNVLFSIDTYNSSVADFALSKSLLGLLIPTLQKYTLASIYLEPSHAIVYSLPFILMVSDRYSKRSSPVIVPNIFLLLNMSSSSAVLLILANLKHYKLYHL